MIMDMQQPGKVGLENMPIVILTILLDINLDNQ